MAATTNSEKWLATYIQQIQELEQFFFQLINDRTLDTAVGAQLNGIGSIVGENRNGRGDTDYRRAVRAKILINKSSGTLEQLVAIVRTLIPDDRTLVVSEDSFPAHFEIDIPQPIDTLPAELITSTAAPYGLADGQTLDAEIDGGATQVVTFNLVDFVDIANATAAEVVAVLTANISGATASRISSRVALRSDVAGDLSSIEITGGTAATAFSFPNGLHTGPEANQALMVKVASSMRTAKANSVKGILLWNTSSTSFGFLGTIGALGFGAGTFASASEG